MTIVKMKNANILKAQAIEGKGIIQFINTKM